MFLARLTSAAAVAAAAAAFCLRSTGPQDGVFVGSGIFKSGNPLKRAQAIVQAVAHYKDPKVLAQASSGLGPAMVGISDLKSDPVNFRDREGGAPHKKRRTDHGQAPWNTWDN